MLTYFMDGPYVSTKVKYVHSDSVCHIQPTNDFYLAYWFLMRQSLYVFLDKIWHILAIVLLLLPFNRKKKRKMRPIQASSHMKVFAYGGSFMKIHSVKVKNAFIVRWSLLPSEIFFLISSRVVILAFKRCFLPFDCFSNDWTSNLWDWIGKYQNIYFYHQSLIFFVWDFVINVKFSSFRTNESVTNSYTIL